MTAPFWAKPKQAFNWFYTRDTRKSGISFFVRDGWIKVYRILEKKGG